MLKLFSGNTFIDTDSGREAETRRSSLIVLFCFLLLCSFIANFLFLSFLFWAVWFLSLTPSKWLCPPPPPLPHLQEKVLKNGIRYVVCILWCTISVTPPTHPHPSLLSAGARRLCLFYCGLGRVPVWAACHIPGYSMYSESCASFFFYFLCCVFFSNYCLTTAVVVAVLFCFFILGLSRPPTLEFGWKCIAVRGW